MGGTEVGRRMCPPRAHASCCAQGGGSGEGEDAVPVRLHTGLLEGPSAGRRAGQGRGGALSAHLYPGLSCHISGKSPANEPLMAPVFLCLPGEPAPFPSYKWGNRG